jgi:hypothetical protein
MLLRMDEARNRFEPTQSQCGVVCLVFTEEVTPTLQKKPEVEYQDTAARRIQRALHWLLMQLEYYETLQDLGIRLSLQRERVGNRPV